MKTTTSDAIGTTHQVCRGLLKGMQIEYMQATVYNDSCVSVLDACDVWRVRAGHPTSDIDAKIIWETWQPI